MSKAKNEKKDLSKAKKIYNVVTTIILAVIFIFLIFVLVVTCWQKASGKDSNLFGYYLYDVVTDSMEPMIKPHDVILAKKVENVNELKVDDVITFTAPSGNLRGHNITHRIVEIARKDNGDINFIRTKGDNAKEKDAWKLKSSAVKATYVNNLKFIGGLRNFVMKWYGFVLTIVCPLVLVIVLLIVSLIKDKAKTEIENAKEKNRSIDLESLSEEEKQKLLKEVLNKGDDRQTKIDVVNNNNNEKDILIEDKNIKDNNDDKI